MPPEESERPRVGSAWRMGEDVTSIDGIALAHQGDLVIIQRVFSERIVTVENIAGPLERRVFNTWDGALVEEVPPLVVIAEQANG